MFLQKSPFRLALKSFPDKIKREESKHNVSVAVHKKTEGNGFFYVCRSRLRSNLLPVVLVVRRTTVSQFLLISVRTVIILDSYKFFHNKSRTLRVTSWGIHVSVHS